MSEAGVLCNTGRVYRDNSVVSDRDLWKRFPDTGIPGGRSGNQIYAGDGASQCILIIALSFVQRVKRSEAIRRLSAAAEIFLTVASIAGSVVIAGCAYKVYDYVWKMDRTPMTMFFKKLNDLLNGRIRILVENDTFEGTIQTWSLFSQPEHMERYFDMGWIRLFYWYGMIQACAFIIVLLGIMYYCYKEKLYAELLLIASFAVYSIIEAHAISVYLARNYVLFLIGQYWYQALAGEKDYVGKVRKL